MRSEAFRPCFAAGLALSYLELMPNKIIDHLVRLHQVINHYNVGKNFATTL